MDDSQYRAVADSLYDAYRTGTETTVDAEFGVEDGYRIQEALVERRRADEGDPVGYKVGFTSAAIQDELGVDEPAFGRLLADTVVSDGRLDLSSFVAPKVEAELAFRLGEELTPPVSVPAVLAATDAVIPAIEVVDSRTGWDVEAATAVADNSLSGRLVHAGAAVDPTALGTDLGLVGMTVRRDGALEATGVGADVLGHPAEAVVWLAGALAERGRTLAAGDLVLTGSATPLVDFASGTHVEAQFGGLGSVRIHGV
jgi:2-keto-4-pentenoate hydratase